MRNDEDSSGQVLVVRHPGVLGMELPAARDMFSIAARLAVEAGLPLPYEVRVASADGSPLDLGNGLTLGGVVALCEHRDPVDTLLVIGGYVAADVAASGTALVDALVAPPGPTTPRLPAH